MANFADMNDYDMIGDTAMWRLTVHISAGRVRAWLKNTALPTTPPRPLLDASWDPKEGKTLQYIESAIYDNPTVLDDFECDVVIETPQYMLMPQEVTESLREESLGEMFNLVYNADEEELITDTPLPGVAGVFFLEKGLLAFLNRTFPGARIRSHLSVLISHASEGHVAEGGLVYGALREGWIDIVAFEEGRLLGAASQRWHSPSDAAYHLLNRAEASGMQKKNMEVRLAGLKEPREEIMPLLEKFAGFAGSDVLPDLQEFETMPLAAALCAARKGKK